MELAMSEIHRSTRLGDLLVEQGVLKSSELYQAIELQQLRRLRPSEHMGQSQELGEILVELGFINAQQLNSGLSWQRRLRKTARIMVFVAPLLTAGCCVGGSSSAGTWLTSSQVEIHS